jgi:hypothetical protein
VETIVQDTSTRDALPLLAFTLRRLYERYGGDGRLSLDEYESLGRLEGAIREEAQRVIAEANPSAEELEALHAAFVPTMVRINAEGGYARRRALFDDLPPRALPLLRRFVDARLLVTDRDPQNRETIEVAHEALLRTWPLLGGWLTEDQDKLRLLESIQRSAEEWDQGGRRDDLLIHRNGRLKDAEALLSNPRFTLPEASVERAYLDACSTAQRAREAAEKEEQERRIHDAERIAEEQKKAAAAQRRTARATLIGLVIAVLVAGLAGWQWREAKNANKLATAGQREAEARLAFDASGDGLIKATLLSAASLRSSQTVDGLVAMTRFLDLLPRNPEWRQPSGQENSGNRDGRRHVLAFSPDGSRIASTDNGGELVRLLDANTGKEVDRVATGCHPSSRTTLAFSPNGAFLAVGCANQVCVLDTISGKSCRLLPHGDMVWAASFSPDSKLLATASYHSDEVFIHDVETWSTEVVRVRQETLVRATAMSPDGE